MNVITGHAYWVIEIPFSYGETHEGCVTESKHSFETFDSKEKWIARIDSIKGDGWYLSQNELQNPELL